jgi:hypothetical protein
VCGTLLRLFRKPDPPRPRGRREEWRQLAQKFGRNLPSRFTWVKAGVLRRAHSLNRRLVLFGHWDQSASKIDEVRDCKNSLVGNFGGGVFVGQVQTQECQSSPDLLPRLT